MNKKFLSVIILLLLTVCISMLFFGCENKESTGENVADRVAKAITVTEKHSGDYVVGETVDLSEIKFSVRYSDKSTEIVTLSDIMLSEEDREKFFVAGVHTVTISYLGVTCPLQISVVENKVVENYKATFFSLGGSSVDAITTDVIKAFPVPEREGYTFDGWYVNIDFSTINTDTTFSGNRVREPYALTKDTDFYAKWLDNRICAVSFVCDANIVLPLPADWETRSEDQRLQVGDVVVGYVTGDNGLLSGMTVTRQSVNVILPVDGEAWSVYPSSDYPKAGDTLIGFQQNKDKKNTGLIILRKDLLLNTFDVHYGEKYDVAAYDLPQTDIDGHGIIIEGKKFVNWNVTNGNANKVTTDLLVRASFQTDKCTVSIYYFNSNNEEIHSEYIRDYGTPFAYSDRVMPTKEGYTSRWVVYYNHSKQYVCPECDFTETKDHKDNLLCPNCGHGTMQERGFEELPDNSGSITLKEEYTLIQAYHVIDTFEIVIQNGIPEQTTESLRSGNIQMEFIYEDAAAKKYFSVDWNSTFDYTMYTQEPKLNTPVAIHDGYSAQWCFVIRDENDKQVWYNTKGQVWSDIEDAFIDTEREEGENENNWILRTSQGEYIATIRNGIPTAIKNDLSMYAKYLKKNRIVYLRRTYENVRGVVARLTIPFYDDFSMFDPMTYENPDMYVFAPDRVSDSDPLPDSVMKNKLATYENVRLYELYLAKEAYCSLKAMISDSCWSSDENYGITLEEAKLLVEYCDCSGLGELLNNYGRTNKLSEHAYAQISSAILSDFDTASAAYSALLGLYAVDGSCSDGYGVRNNGAGLFVEFCDCSAPGILLKDNGVATNLSNHSDATLPAELFDSFDYITDKFASFLAYIGVSQNSLVDCTLTSESDGYADYRAFCSKAKDLFDSSKLSSTYSIGLANTISTGIVLGINKPFVVRPGACDVSYDDLLAMTATLFGYTDVNEFVANAQSIVAEYVGSSSASTANSQGRLYYDGTVYTQNGAFIAPLSFERNSFSANLAFLIVDADSTMSIWYANVDSAISMSQRDYYTVGDELEIIRIHGRCTLFETPMWVPGSSTDAYASYVAFFNEIKDLFHNTNDAIINAVTPTLTKGAIVGIDNRYTISVADHNKTYAQYLEVAARLFGYNDVNTFKQYAQTLASVYINNAEGADFSVVHRTMYDGAVYTKNGSFLLPYAFKNDLADTVLACLVVERTGNISIWLSDVDAAFSAVNYDNSYTGSGLKKITIEGRCRLFEITRSADIINVTFGAESKKEDFVKFYVWLSQNAKDLALMIDICTVGDSNIYNVPALQAAVESAFGLRIYNSDAFKSLIQGYLAMDSSYGDDLYAWNHLEELTAFYTAHITDFNNFGLGYSTPIFERGISFEGIDMNACRLDWLYYSASPAYKFFRLQIDRSQLKFVDYIHAKNYEYDYSVLYLSDPLNHMEYEEYYKYRSVYNANRNTSGYMYYYCGLENAEDEITRLTRILLASREDIVRFYLFKDSNVDIMNLSSFYTLDEGNTDWSIEWYRSAEMLESGYLDFFNDTYTVTVDTSLYCKDIDNRRYELTFQYDYDFDTNKYNATESFSVVNWSSVHYYTLDLASGKFVPATNSYDPTAEYYSRDPEKYFTGLADSYANERWNYYKNHLYERVGNTYSLTNGAFDRAKTYYRYDGATYVAVSPADLEEMHGSIWSVAYEYFFTFDSASNKYVKATDTYFDDVVYYSNYRLMNMAADVELAEGYDSSVIRIKNGVLLSYEFIGWYDVPYYSYLLTGYRGNSLRVLSSHSENVTYYAHYSCTTTYTVKIYDTTQSTAYAGVKNYQDGYAVDDNTIEYVLPAGSILSLSDVYKGFKIDETSTVGGQEYYRQKLYIEYFDDYYNTNNAAALYQKLLQPYASKEECIELFKKVIRLYKTETELYKKVVDAVQKQNYSAFEPEVYDYYLSSFTQRATKSGDEYVFDRHAFVVDFISVLADISEKKYIDVSTFTGEFTDYLIHMPEYTEATGLARIYAEKWSEYYRNFYTFDGGVYSPVSASSAFDPHLSYYTYLFTTDYDYDCILISILEQYVDFLQGYDTYKKNYDAYRMNPRHLYINSMNDINAASDYDYEGAGELKYNFINWYLDSAYTSVFMDTYEDQYYLANEEAYLDSASWNDVYTRYYVFDPITGRFVTASSTYKEAERYYVYDRDSFFPGDTASFAADRWKYFVQYLYVQNGSRYEPAEGDYDAMKSYYAKNGNSYTLVSSATLATYQGSTWSSSYIYFYTFDKDKRMYVPAESTYDPNAVYYSKYKDVTTVVSSRLAGWSSNYQKYFVLNNDVFVPVAEGSAYDPTANYYASSEIYMSLVVSRDLVLYAKWMDISRGTEGLVYQLVTDENTGNSYYVVIDFVNNAQSREEGYYNTTKSYYYVTTNDNGMIPEVIVQGNETISLQIPASITSYQDATASAVAANNNGQWASEYTNYLIYNTISFAYEPASRTFDANAKYFDKNVQVVYPVVGIRQKAFDKYKTYISEVNLPLNLYFIEEGAFNLCPIESFSRAKPRTSETELNYIVVDHRDEVGIAIYQVDACPFVLAASEDGYVYSFASANTILAYAVSNTMFTNYVISEGTKRVGNYVFRGSGLTEITFGGTPVVESIGDYSFSRSQITSFVVYTSLEEIGAYAFSHALELSRVSVLSNSLLCSIGKGAFDDTAWFKEQKGIVKMNWQNSTEMTGAIVGFNVPTGGGYVYYDKKNNEYVTYNEFGVETPSGDYYAISNGNDRILYHCTKNAYGQVISVSLHGVIIASKITLIADNAFDVQQGFGEFIIESKYLRYIGDEAFKNCPILDKITFQNATAGVKIGHDVFSGKGSNSVTIVDTTGLVRTGDNWSEYDDIIR